MKFYNDILGLIGKTPLVRINNITKQLKIKAPIYAKMESLNPGYSVKDRIGISMIDWAEREGVLKKGGTIIEATSGNTGIGLALVAAVRGYKCIFVLTEKASTEKVRYLKGLGADIVVCPAAAKPGTPSVGEHDPSPAAPTPAATPTTAVPAWTVPAAMSPTAAAMPTAVANLRDDGVAGGRYGSDGCGRCGARHENG